MKKNHLGILFYYIYIANKRNTDETVNRIYKAALKNPSVVE